MSKAKREVWVVEKFMLSEWYTVDYYTSREKAELRRKWWLDILVPAPRSVLRKRAANIRVVRYVPAPSPRKRRKKTKHKNGAEKTKL